jgi:hypothetical protein
MRLAGLFRILLSHLPQFSSIGAALARDRFVACNLRQQNIHSPP